MLEDFAATLRPFAADPQAYDAIIDQWLFEVTVPEYRLLEVRRELVGERWQVVLRIENVGDGRVPVEVAAVAGERFDDQGHPEAGYRDVRRSVTLPRLLAQAPEDEEPGMWTEVSSEWSSTALGRSTMLRA